MTNDKGERKTSGAYYTPEDWVSYIVAAHLAAGAGGAWGARRSSAPDSFAEAVLQLNVCDPAMGSGHFWWKPSLISPKPWPPIRPPPRARCLSAEGRPAWTTHGEPVCTEEAKLAYWKRRLVEACIYGVDLNPLAVELAKLSLWLETVDRVPLNFLDHHLRCGNSLLGTTLAALPKYPELKKTGKKENARSAFAGVQ